MKIFLTLFTICILFLDFTAQLSGTAYLSGQTNHSGIKIKFLSNGGTAVTDSTTTNSNGNFSINITGGSYKVKYSKNGYIDVDYNNGGAIILTNTVSLSSQTLIPGNQVFVNGNVSGIWTNNNTYIINGDLAVPYGQTLTIQPGTTIRFNGSYSITANGIINAVGTPALKILFTSNLISPNPADWKGIFVNSSGSAIKYCVLDYGESGIWINNVSPQISNNEIRNFTYIGIYANNCSSNINNNWVHDYQYYTATGIGIGGSSTATVQCNKIHDGGGYGIRPFSPCLVSNNEIYNINSNQRGYGMDVGVSTPTIQNNYIHHCLWGIRIGSNVTPIPNPIIVNNTILNNTGDGIQLIGFYANASIINNIIVGNGAGIYQTPGCSITEVSNNLVWNNSSANYISVQITGVGQIVSTNSNGDAVDSYFNLSQDPLFSFVPNLTASSPCLNAGKLVYSNNIGFTSTLTCVSGVNAIEKIDEQKTFISIYPNPSHNNLFVKVENFNGEQTFEVFDAMGRSVYKKQGDNKVTELNLYELNKGIYFLTIKEKGSVISMKKFVLQ